MKKTLENILINVKDLNWENRLWKKSKNYASISWIYNNNTITCITNPPFKFFKINDKQLNLKEFISYIKQNSHQNDIFQFMNSIQIAIKGTFIFDHGHFSELIWDFKNEKYIARMANPFLENNINVYTKNTVVHHLSRNIFINYVRSHSEFNMLPFLKF